jgi:hypothetical protein
MGTVGVYEGWRKLHNEELHNLYSSPSIIRMINEDEMGRACSTNGSEEEHIDIGYRWGKPGENIPIGRPRRRWEDNIKIDLRATE